MLARGRAQAPACVPRGRRRGSFTAAARRLGVAQSAVSQLVRVLEVDLGTPLLTRTTRSNALTPAGAQLVDHLRPAVVAVDAALARVRAAAAGPGLLRVGFTAGGVGPLLTEVLHAYSAATPGRLRPPDPHGVDARPGRPAVGRGRRRAGTATRRHPRRARAHAVQRPTRRRTADWHRLARSRRSRSPTCRTIPWSPAPAPRHAERLLDRQPTTPTDALRCSVRGAQQRRDARPRRLGHGVCIAAATLAEHYSGTDVVFRPVADLPPLPCSW
jgi:DNA-binding transcriptional LysR family regulator